MGQTRKIDKIAEIMSCILRDPQLQMFLHILSILGKKMKRGV